MTRYIKILLILLSISFGYSAHAATDFLKFPDLQVGQTSTFVKELQKALNNNGFIITNAGAGSIGQESTYFGSLTKKALANFQTKNNIAPVTGNLGVKTKAKLNEFLASGKFKSISTGTPVGYGSDTCSSVADGGVTWYFQGTPVCGQFANGDWWVVGPVTITNITPKDTDPNDTICTAYTLPAGTCSQRSPQDTNGSMINPIPRANQGFDSNLGNNMSYTGIGQDGTMKYGIGEVAYNPSLNVARSFPFTVQPSSSLVSSKTANTYPNYVRTIAALTVLSTPPPEGSFRPTIYGSDKTIPANRNKSNINWGILKDFAPVVGTPTKAQIEATLPGLPWFEWHEHVVTSVFLPEDNTATGIIDITRNIPSTYGREIAFKWGDIGLWLNLKLSQDPNESRMQKEYAMIQTIQSGIDIGGYLQYGGKFTADGGQRAGRKFPLVFAAAALNDQSLKNFSSAGLVFQEDQQTFFVAQADVTRPAYLDNLRYVDSDIWRPDQGTGIADWGIRHAIEPYKDDKRFFDGVYYRRVVWPAMKGPVLAADLMNLESLWNHDPIFRYNERYTALQGAPSNTFVENMWKTYKSGTQPQCTQNCGGGTTTVTHSDPSSFLCGDTVVTYKTTTYINPTEAISSNPLGSKPAGTQAKVLSGPTLAGGIYWYSMSYDNGALIGYSGGDNFDLVSRGTCTGGNQTTYVLTATSAGTGTGTFSGAGSYAAGATATITANPNSGSTFSSWSGCTSTSGNVCTVTMPAAAKTVTATFNPVVTTIIPPDITLPIASSVTSTTGSVNLAWDAVPGANAYYVRMREFTDSSRTVETGRKYDNNTNAFYLYKDGNTSRSIAGVDLDPNRYYEFWVNAYNTSAPGTYSANATLYFNTAGTVAVQNFTLSASKLGTGTGSIVGISAATTTLPSGTNITLTPEANPGSAFVGWGGDCSGTGSCALTMNGNKAITATFTLNAVTSADDDNDGVLNASDKCPLTPSALATTVNNYGCPKPVTTNLRINNNLTTTDLTSISNLEIEDKNGIYGKIRYNQPVNIFGTSDRKSQMYLDPHVTITNKRVSVDSPNAPQLNAPATITLYNVNLTKPLIKKNGEVYATSSSPLMSYDPVAKTLTFIVTGFSEYDVIEDTAIYTLTASKSGNGSGSILGVDSATTILTEGTSISLTAQADAGSIFNGWTGSCVGTGSCLVTMNADKSVDAAFALVSASTGGGSAPSAGGGGGGGGGGGSAPVVAGAYVNPNNTGLGAKPAVAAAPGARYVFRKDLKVYARDPEVIQLQKFLNSRGYVVAKKGAGSPGLESTYFGPATKAALARFQKDNKISPAAGYFGKITKAALNK